MRQALRVISTVAVLSLILSATVLHADSHEVRYTPTNEAYGACRAAFPYSHLEDCNKDYDFLMLFWLEHMESEQAEPTVYESCEAAETAGIPLQQGSIGDEFGFPAELIPSAANGDGDTMVCERELQLTPTATPEPLSISDNLTALIYCDRVRLEARMYWGQAPGLVYSGDPRVSGQLQQGDYIRFITSEPNEHGELRVKVFPHDGRAVGKTNDQVWISWETVTQYRLDLVVFKCEL